MEKISSETQEDQTPSEGCSTKASKSKTEPTALPAFKTDNRELLRTARKASQDGVSQATGYEFFVPFRRIVGSDNPRFVPRNLYALGYKLVDPSDEEHSLIHLATSANLEDARQCVTLFEEHENDPADYLEDDRDVPIGETASKSIVGLAEQFRKSGQLQAITVRPVGKGENRTLIFGQRRTAAAVYLHAKSRLEVEDGVEGAKIIPGVIRAVVRTVSSKEAYDMAVGENLHRQDFTPLEEAAIYVHDLAQINPETGKKYTLKQVAQKRGENQGRVRSYAALLQPRDETTQKGLTDEDRTALANKEITVTAAVRKALNEKHYSDGHRQGNRAKPIPLKAIHQLFDDTSESNEERRKAFAECMGVTLEVAVAQSEERISAIETKETNRRHRGVEEVVENAENDEFVEE